MQIFSKFSNFVKKTGFNASYKLCPKLPFWKKDKYRHLLNLSSVVKVKFVLLFEVSTLLSRSGIKFPGSVNVHYLVVSHSILCRKTSPTSGARKRFLPRMYSLMANQVGMSIKFFSTERALVISSHWPDLLASCTNAYNKQKYSWLSLSRIPRDSLKYFEISVPRHIRFAELRKKIIRTTTFNKYMCNWTLEVRNIHVYIK